MTTQIRSVLKKNIAIYLLACAAALGLNLLYRSGDPALLIWILKPTARWAGILGGLSFEYAVGLGYVNETHRFLIAPPCCGVRFLQTMLLLLVFSYTHRIDSRIRRRFWLPFCLLFSYICTVPVNGLRIALSVHIPAALERSNRLPQRLTQGQLHTLIGTAVYFSALLMLQPAIRAVVSGLFIGNGAGKRNSLAPVFWYFLAVLGMPFLKRLAAGAVTGFIAYAFPIVLACFVVMLVKCLISHVFSL